MMKTKRTIEDRDPLVKHNMHGKMKEDYQTLLIIFTQHVMRTDS